MIFLTFFKTLEGKEVTVELKNDLALRGQLESVDQYLNLKLSGVQVVDQDKFPQLVRSYRARMDGTRRVRESMWARRVQHGGSVRRRACGARPKYGGTS